MAVRSYVATRKLGFFVAELLLLCGAFIGSASAAARLLGLGSDGWRLGIEAACATAALQSGLYLADLYDLKIAYEDAPRATRLLKVIGGTTILLRLAPPL